MGDDGLPPPAPFSRPASAPMGSKSARGVASVQRAAQLSEDKAPELPKIYTRKHVYPVGVDAPPPRPMSATQVARVDRVREKKRLLNAQFLGRPPAEYQAAKGEKVVPVAQLPPWWSTPRFGDPASSLKRPSKDLTSSLAIEGIRRTLEDLRGSLGDLPWADGTPAGNTSAERERRIRAEISDMEMWMRDHLIRKAEYIYRTAHAPAISPKTLLLISFQRRDQYRTGDVTVAEFADVWNNPSKEGLHLMVPIQKLDPEQNQMVDVRLNRAGLLMPDGKTRLPIDPRMAAERWRLNGCRWDSEMRQFSELEEDTPAEMQRARLLLRPKKVLEAHAAALFLKYGFDRDGLMPYEVFVNALFTPSARLLGMQPILNQRSRGRHGYGKDDNASFDGKILYAKAKAGVFPPADFDPEVVKRSEKMPSASLQLEHVYGYDGRNNLAKNIFFTDNPEEIVYYAAAVGVVHNLVTQTQRHFFGHNNDILSIAQHPCKWIVATGQQVQTGPEETPFLCVWETRGCRMLQRIDHPKAYRGVIALGFSPDGRRLCAVTCDNDHSLFIWDWLTDSGKLRWLSGCAVEAVPSWPASIAPYKFGPVKRMGELGATDSGFFYRRKFAYGKASDQIVVEDPDAVAQVNRDFPLLEAHLLDGLSDEEKAKRRATEEYERAKAGLGDMGDAAVLEQQERRDRLGTGPAYSGRRLKEAAVPLVAEEDRHRGPGAKEGPDSWKEGGDFRLAMGDPLSASSPADAGDPVPASSGSPPQVFSVLWNPYTPGEFITYGVKHIKFWRWDPNAPQPGAGGEEGAGQASSGGGASAKLLPRSKAAQRAGAWVCVSGSFGGQSPGGAAKAPKVDNVLCAIFIPDPMWPHRRLESDPETRKPLHMWADAKVSRTGKVIKQRYDEHGKDPYRVFAEKYEADVDVDSPGHALVVTGFVSGDIGFWMKVVAEPPRGATGHPATAREAMPVNWVLSRVIREAHQPGPRITMPDGSVNFMGVRGLTLTEDKKMLLSAGADGIVQAWDVRQTVDDDPVSFRRLGMEVIHSEPELKERPQGQRKQWDPKSPELARAVAAAAVKVTKVKDMRWGLESPYPGQPAPMLRTAESRPGTQEFVVGTYDCEIWLLRPDAGGQASPDVQLVAGNSDELHGLAAHPTDGALFASACDSGNVKLWDGRRRRLLRATNVGFGLRAAAFSACGKHLAVGGTTGKLKLMKSDTLQPLCTFANAKSGITVLKYSPNNRVLACGSHDLIVDLYDTGFRMDKGERGAMVSGTSKVPVCRNWEKDVGGTGQYQLLRRCEGHSATIRHIDFSLPLWNPPELRGRTVVMSQCSGYEVLFWDSQRGEQILQNMRSTKWASRTSTLGFDVMGIWPDGSFAAQVDSLCRSRSQEYAVTGEHFSCVKLFNYPVVSDDAPHRRYKGHSSYVTCSRFTADDKLVVTAGGGDKCVFQWRTSGVAEEDALETRCKAAPWCDVELCTFCGRQELPAPPPPPWGPLDAEGRTWGSISFNPRTGACSCENCELRLLQEFTVLDEEGTGFVDVDEVVPALRNFGEATGAEGFLGRVLAGAKVTPVKKVDPATGKELGGEMVVEYRQIVRYWVHENLAERRRSAKR